ncbi:Ger(x)C family spore germination protein [Paenibacillus sp. HWE-109]|uniref:Ger(x)C family spore germination protein n=1 Tax=Paenibacillus sp. HWE-109 TaxID=1306526 RepID=UPI001EDE9499|nr:Ger(x)C family spore germination protein [Paenibacillus sp. HWE-109]UKS30891.1 Ger(x)C family spore germination protein [Paenibacillus sp. HWE-109]
MRKRFCLTMLLSTTVVFSGCVKPSILENLALGIIIGYDALENERILTTSVLQKIDPSAREKTQVVASTAFTSKGSRISSNRELSKNLVGGQVRVVMYGKKLASKGIIDMVDTLSRDPTLGDMIYLCVSDDEASHILTHRYREISNIGMYLYENLKQNSEREELPSPTLQDFLRDYYSVGKDPVIPLLKRKGNEVYIKGLALFHDDRMVHEASPRQGFLLKVICNTKKAGYYELIVGTEKLAQYLEHPDTEVKLVFANARSSSSIKLLDTKKPEFALSVSILGDLQEISVHYPLDKAEAIAALQQEIEKKLKKEIEAFLTSLQTNESDAVGFGEVYRSHIRNTKLTKDKWHLMFKEAKINVHVNFNLRHTGAIE